MTKKIRTTITIDADVLAAVDAAATLDRAERSDYLNRLLARLHLPPNAERIDAAPVSTTPNRRRARKTKL